MLKVIGSMNRIQLATDEASLAGIRAAAEKGGAKLDLEQKGNRLFGRAIFLGYDLPNGNGDAIPSFYASTFGPSFIDKHLDYEHKEDEANIIGKIRATWHVEREIPVGEGPRVIGRNAFGRDIAGRAPIFRLAGSQGQDVRGSIRELLVEGIFEINRDHKMGDIIARRLLSGEMDSVSQEASTAYCQCSVCAHKIQFPFDPICDHLVHGSLMLRSWKVDGYEEEMLGYKVHHEPVGTGLGVVQVPAFDRAQIARVSAALKSGQMSYEAALAMVNEHDRMLGKEADRTLVTAARRDFELVARDLAKPARRKELERTLLDVAPNIEDKMVGMTDEDLQVFLDHQREEAGRKGEEWAKDPKASGIAAAFPKLPPIGESISQMDQMTERLKEIGKHRDLAKSETDPEKAAEHQRHADELLQALKKKPKKVRANGDFMDDEQHPFVVYNNFDDMPAFHESFASIDEALAAAEEKMEGWKAQGYYKTSDGLRVPFDALTVGVAYEGSEAPEDFTLAVIDDRNEGGWVKRGIVKADRVYNDNELVKIHDADKAQEKMLDRIQDLWWQGNTQSNDLAEDIIRQGVERFSSDFEKRARAMRTKAGKRGVVKADLQVKAGFFSWRTSDTDRTIVSFEYVSPDQKDEGTQVLEEATLLLPNGKKISGTYDGYGRLGGKDIYAEVWGAMSKQKVTPANMEKIRDEAFEHFDEVNKNIKLVEDGSLSFEGTEVSESAGSQGYFFDEEVDDEDNDVDASLKAAADPIEAELERLRDGEFSMSEKSVAEGDKALEAALKKAKPVWDADADKSFESFCLKATTEEIAGEALKRYLKAKGAIKASTKKPFTADDFTQLQQKAKGMSDAEIRYAVKDAQEAEKAMKGHDEIAENWYRDYLLTLHDELVSRESKPKAALLSAIAATAPAENESPAALARKVHSAAVIEARLNRETASIVRHAAIAVGLDAAGTLPEAGLLATASRAAALAAAQEALDKSKASMAARTGLALYKGAGEGSIPAWTMAHVAAGLRKAAPGSPRFETLRVEAERAVPSVLGFHARLSHAILASTDPKNFEIAPSIGSLTLSATFEDMKRKVESERQKPGAFGAAKIKVAAERFAEALEALAKAEEPHKFSMPVLAACDLAMGRHKPAFAARRLRLPEAAMNTIKAASAYEFKVAPKDGKFALQSLDRSGKVLKEEIFDTQEAAVAAENARQQGENRFVNISVAKAALAVLAGHTADHLRKPERDAAQVIAAGRPKDSAQAQAQAEGFELLAASIFAFDGCLVLDALKAAKAGNLVAASLLESERLEASKRALMAAWTRIYDADPSASPNRLAAAVARGAKAPVGAALFMGIRLRSAGGIWPWTGEKPESWPAFVEARSDQELEAMATEWEGRLPKAVGNDARTVIESNVRRLKSVLDARRQAKGCSASLVGSPDPLGGYWLLKAADGGVLFRVPVRRIVAGRRDAIAAKWATSPEYGARLSATAQAFGAGALWESMLAPRADKPKRTYKDAEREYEKVEHSLCPACEGKGCPACAGSGNVPKIKADGASGLRQGNRKPYGKDEHNHGLGSDSIRHSHGPYVPKHKHASDPKQRHMDSPGWREGEGVQEQGLGEGRGRKWVQGAEQRIKRSSLGDYFSGADYSHALNSNVGSETVVTGKDGADYKINNLDDSTFIIEKVRGALSGAEMTTGIWSEPKAGVRRVKVSYEIVTPESAEEGDAEEYGEHDELILDQSDADEEGGFAKAAADYIKREGGTEPSSSDFHPGVWYSSYPDTDYKTSAETSYSFHLDGFTPEEEKEVWDLLTGKKGPRGKLRPKADAPAPSPRRVRELGKVLNKSRREVFSDDPERGATAERLIQKTKKRLSQVPEGLDRSPEQKKAAYDREQQLLFRHASRKVRGSADAHEVAEMLFCDQVAREVEDSEGEFYLEKRTFTAPQQDILDTVPAELEAAGVDAKAYISKLARKLRIGKAELLEKAEDHWAAFNRLSEEGYGNDEAYEALTEYFKQKGLRGSRKSKGRFIVDQLTEGGPWFILELGPQNRMTPFYGPFATEEEADLKLENMLTASVRAKDDASAWARERATRPTHPGGLESPPEYPDPAGCPVEGCENASDRFQDTTDEGGESWDVLPCEECHTPCEECGKEDVLKAGDGVCEGCAGIKARRTEFSLDPADPYAGRDTGKNWREAAQKRNKEKEALREKLKKAIKPADGGTK